MQFNKRVFLSNEVFQYWLNRQRHMLESFISGRLEILYESYLIILWFSISLILFNLIIFVYGAKIMMLYKNNLIRIFISSIGVFSGSAFFSPNSPWISWNLHDSWFDHSVGQYCHDYSLFLHSLTFLSNRSQLDDLPVSPLLLNI